MEKCDEGKVTRLGKREAGKERWRGSYCGGAVVRLAAARLKGWMPHIPTRAFCGTGLRLNPFSAKTGGPPCHTTWCCCCCLDVPVPHARALPHTHYATYLLLPLAVFFHTCAIRCYTFPQPRCATHTAHPFPHEPHRSSSHPCNFGPLFSHTQTTLRNPSLYAYSVPYTCRRGVSHTELASTLDARILCAHAARAASRALMCSHFARNARPEGRRLRADLLPKTSWRRTRRWASMRYGNDNRVLAFCESLAISYRLGTSEITMLSNRTS